MSPVRPDTSVEQRLLAEGAGTVVGVDEVGKGAWAGPLVVGVAVLPAVVVASGLDGALAGLRDSKTIAERRREAMFEPVGSACAAWATGEASNRECDELGMSAAQRLAASRAFEALGRSVDLGAAAAVVDGRWDFVSPLVGRVSTVVGGDARCASVSAAALLAKVVRDRTMRCLAEDLPHWSFASNKGYPCPRHRTALAAHGPSSAHRTSWAFMESVVPWLGAGTRP
ncbi:MAG: ribonuclease [Planctomycetota bacterium]